MGGADTLTLRPVGLMRRHINRARELASSYGNRWEAMLAGFDIHVAKPAEPAELVAVVGRLARRT